MTIETHIGDPKNTAGIAGHPIYPTLIPFPTAFFAVILARGVVFRVTGDIC